MATITFNTYVAGGVSDLQKTKSSVNAPTWYDKDLQGCGNVTHHYTSVSTSILTRPNCLSPQLLFNRSISGLQLIPAVAAGYGGVAATVATAVYNGGQPLSFDDLNTYLGTAVAFAQGGDYNYEVAPLLALIDNQLTLQPPQRRGQSWRFTDVAAPAKPQIIVTVQLARLTPIIDQCGLTQGVKGVSSLTVEAQDANCVPRLIAQQSMSFAYSTNGLVVAANWTPGEVQTPFLENNTYERLTMGQSGAGNFVTDTITPLPFDVVIPNGL